MDTVLRCYYDRARVRRDVTAAIASYPNLRSSASCSQPPFACAHKIVSSSPLLTLSGTVSIATQGAAYDVPICVWISESYPYAPPTVMVLQTTGMRVCRGHSHVDLDGFVSLPYLSSWHSSTHSLLGTIISLCQVFSLRLPLCAAQAQPVYPSVGQQPEDLGHCTAGNQEWSVRWSGERPLRLVIGHLLSSLRKMRVSEIRRTILEQDPLALGELLSIRVFSCQWRSNITLLSCSVLMRDLALAELLIDLGASATESDALVVAVRVELPMLQMIELLLRRGAASGHGKDEALEIAVKKVERPVVEVLLHAGGSGLSRCLGKLCRRRWYPSLELVEILLQCGALVDPNLMFRHWLLHEVDQPKSWLDTIQALGIDIGASLPGGSRSPLQIVLSAPFSSGRRPRLLLERSARCGTCTPRDFSSFVHSLESGKTWSCTQACAADVLSHLLVRGAYSNELEVRSAGLRFVCLTDVETVEIVALIVQAGFVLPVSAPHVRVHLRNFCLRCPEACGFVELLFGMDYLTMLVDEFRLLHNCCENQAYTGSLIALLARGFDPNLRDRDGLTPLMVGVTNDECVRILLSYGASVTAMSDQGHTAIGNLWLRVPGQSVAFLLEQGADLLDVMSLYLSEDDFVRSCESRDEDMRLLVESGMPLEARNRGVLGKVFPSPLTPRGRANQSSSNDSDTLCCYSFLRVPKLVPKSSSGAKSYGYFFC